MEQFALLTVPTALVSNADHAKHHICEKISFPILIFYWLIGIAYGIGKQEAGFP
jgi:hypothetical protein